MLEQYGDILTVNEVQEILKINRKTVYRLIKSKKVFRQEDWQGIPHTKTIYLRVHTRGRAISSSPFKYKEAIIWMK